MAIAGPAELVPPRPRSRAAAEAGHGARPHREELEDGAPGEEAAALLHEVGAREAQERADRRRVERQANGILIGQPAARADGLEAIVTERELQVVRVERHERRVL